jgi:hypothetical protein
MTTMGGYLDLIRRMRRNACDRAHTTHAIDRGKYDKNDKNRIHDHPQREGIASIAPPACRDTVREYDKNDKNDIGLPTPQSATKKSSPRTTKIGALRKTILAAVHAHPGRYLWQQLAAAGVPFGTRADEEAILAAVRALLAEGALRQTGTTPREPVSLWMTLGLGHGDGRTRASDGPDDDGDDHGGARRTQ